jgi:hypothetical protein
MFFAASMHEGQTSLDLNYQLDGQRPAITLGTLAHFNIL